MSELTTNYTTGVYYDELIQKDGSPRPPAKQLFNYLSTLSPDELEKNCRSNCAGNGDQLHRLHRRREYRP